MEKELIIIGIKLEKYKRFLIDNMIAVSSCIQIDGSNPGRKIIEIHLYEFQKHFQYLWEGFENESDFETIKRRWDKIVGENEKI